MLGGGAANYLGREGGPLTPQQQHHCPYCPQSFSFHSILKRHLRTHTGEKPFECPSCDYRSAYKYHVARHMKLHSVPTPQSLLEGGGVVMLPLGASETPGGDAGGMSHALTHGEGIIAVLPPTHTPLSEGAPSSSRGGQEPDTHGTPSMSELDAMSVLMAAHEAPGRTQHHQHLPPSTH